MKTAMPAIAILSIFCIVALAGAPQGGGLSWDNTATLARINAAERLEAQRLALRDAEGERSAEFWQLALWLVGGVVVVGIVARGAVQVHRQRTESQTAIMLAALPILQRRPGAYLDRVDGAWYVVDDDRQELVPVSHRLNGEIR